VYGVVVFEAKENSSCSWTRDNDEDMNELQWHPFKTFCLKYFNMVQNMIRKRLANIEKSPNKGMASLVAGIVSARTCENTVRDSRIVTPEINIQVDYYQMVAV
jgi:hypothetical protein